MRYVRWLGQAVQGNLGYRAVGGQPVTTVVTRGLRGSAVLMGTALAIGCLIGIPFGIISALRQYSRTDFALTTLAFLGISTPSFLLGLGGLYIFGLKLGLFPIGGMTTAGQPFCADSIFCTTSMLPALILSAAYVAILMRYTRSSMLEVINATYISTARAKGLRERAGDPGTCLPQRADPDYHRDRPGAARDGRRRGDHRDRVHVAGMGSLLVEGVSGRDYPLIMGISLLVGTTVLFANLLTDIAYALVDPRIRYQ